MCSLTHSKLPTFHRLTSIATLYFTIACSYGSRFLKLITVLGRLWNVIIHFCSRINEYFLHSSLFLKKTKVWLDCSTGKKFLSIWKVSKTIKKKISRYYILSFFAKLYNRKILNKKNNFLIGKHSSFSIVINVFSSEATL